MTLHLTPPPESKSCLDSDYLLFLFLVLISFSAQLINYSIHFFLLLNIHILHELAFPTLLVSIFEESALAKLLYAALIANPGV